MIFPNKYVTVMRKWVILTTGFVEVSQIDKQPVPIMAPVAQVTLKWGK